MEIRRHRPAAAAGALLLAAGCASLRPAPSAELLTAARGGEGRRCWAAADPHQLPGAAELIDADAFAARAGRLWEGAGKPAGYVVFSVRHAADGVQVRRSVVESTLPPALADTLQKLVYAFRRQAPEARAEWGVRLRVDPGEPVALRVGRREECTPRPRDPQFRTVSTYDIRESDVDAASRPARTDESFVWVRVSLNEAGLVTDAQVERRVLAAVAEQRLLAYVRGLTFDPGLDDGEPVASETTIPVRLSLAR